MMAHDLNDRATVMTLGGVAQLIDGLDSGIHSRIVADGVFAAGDVVIDGAGQADAGRDILERMRQTQVTGKKHFIIIVSEGVVGAQELANQIQAATGVDSRATVLGHIQRGGSPTVRDRVNASLMGYHAIDLLDKGIYNRVVAVSGDKIVDYDVNVALSMHKTIDRDMIEIAKAISI
jgi:6-phosphofructokinase 1